MWNQLKKLFFLNNVQLLFDAREKVLNGFKGRTFSLKDELRTLEPAPEPTSRPTSKRRHELTRNKKNIWCI